MIELAGICGGDVGFLRRSGASSARMREEDEG